MQRRLLVKYIRGGVVTGSVIEEVDDKRITRMYIELETKSKDGVSIERIEVKERDQELAEMKLSDLMTQKFHKAHGRVAKKSI